ncbi:O-antigen ligase family protein [Hyalangium rubrum]|uniref:O-antigen ligase family protein n=1 Tax=Hyalangium rubrum TaxID=3103134 RepID=A0ABU5H4H4_9BACT|nr:O-antigen ligase family protein [Hyalangium sp. s54d21]MDY7227682.1 O-antigen ligase family protein [Hyalangium sp. s54d21]
MKPSPNGLSRWLVPAMVVTVTLAVAPGGETPFSGVKTAVFGVASVALLLRAALLGSSSHAPLAPRVLAGLWIGTLALSQFLGPAASPGGMWLEAAAGVVILSLLQAPPEPGPALRAIAGAGTALALVAGLQFLGVDPFRWMGWASTHPGERMRIYGTLGNPNFVAAYLGASLCITLGEAASAARASHRRAWAAAAVLQLGALAATRSWGSVLAVGAAALSLAWTRTPTPRSEISRGRGWGALVLAGFAAALLLLAVSGRSLSTVLAGRLYLWEVAAPHVFDAPVFGHGPGSFVTLWPAWEAEYWARGAPAEQERFVAPQDHAHLDYLEWLLSLGLVGTAPRLLLLLAALRAGRQAPDARGRAVIAALVALAARALTDFPFARPAELCLLAVLTTLALHRKP